MRTRLLLPAVLVGTAMALSACVVVPIPSSGHPSKVAAKSKPSPAPEKPKTVVKPKKPKAAPKPKPSATSTTPPPVTGPLTTPMTGFMGEDEFRIGNLIVTTTKPATFTDELYDTVDGGTGTSFKFDVTLRNIGKDAFDPVFIRPTVDYHGIQAEPTVNIGFIQLIPAGQSLTTTFRFRIPVKGALLVALNVIVRSLIDDPKGYATYVNY